VADTTPTETGEHDEDQDQNQGWQGEEEARIVAAQESTMKIRTRIKAGKAVKKKKVA
jgi:hypothetical protein